MKFDALEAFGIRREMIDAWNRDLGGELLPVQERAIVQHGLFAGRNLVVFAPTSSGKTMIGEMVAAKVAEELLCLPFYCNGPERAHFRPSSAAAAALSRRAARTFPVPLAGFRNSVPRVFEFLASYR